MTKSNSESIEFGAVPRARLLPPEVLQRVRDRRARRGAVSLIILALIISAAATVAATLYSLSAAVVLAGAQAETAAIIAQQNEFADIRGLQSELENAQDARAVAMSTEVDWTSWTRSVAAKLPSGSFVVSIFIDEGTPNESFPTASVPLQGPRIAGVTYEISTPTIADVSTWLVALASVDGYVDSTTPVVSQNPTTGTYISTTVIYVDESVYTLRFDENQ